MSRPWIIANRSAGNAAELAATTSGDPFPGHDLRLVTISETEDVESCLRRARDDGATLVIAAGGDGTVNAVANAIYRSGRSVPMAVLPAGTANDFAWTLGMPPTIHESLTWILANADSPRSVDLVEVEDGFSKFYYLNVAAGGNSDRVTAALTDEIKQRWGPLCYVRGAMEVITDLNSFQTQVIIDDASPIELSLWNVIVANGRTNAGHLPIAPQASIEDGLLDIILIRDGTLGELTSLVAKFLLSDYLDSEQVIYRRAQSLHLQSDPRMQFSIDGEPTAAPPIRFTAIAGAIAIVVGPHYISNPQLPDWEDPNSLLQLTRPQ